MKWFKRKQVEPAPEVPNCFHEFKLESVYTHYWDNGYNTSADLMMVTKCIHCYATKEMDELDYTRSVRHGLIKGVEEA